nr:MAG TPA: hypothetical protein [Caudoviricetes sp.]
MQTLIETLNLYNNAFDALCEARNLVEQLELETAASSTTTRNQSLCPQAGTQTATSQPPPTLNAYPSGP